MAKDAQRLEQEFISASRQKTGHDVVEWMTIIGASGLDEPKVIQQWLEETHDLDELDAALLAGIFLNGGRPLHEQDITEFND